MPSWLRDNARRDPERVGLREKEFGIWQETTYAEYWELVRTVGMALRAMGVVPGDKVAIQSENRLAWVVGDLAAQGIQAVSVGLYSTNPAAEVEYLLHHSDSKVLIAEDQEQVDKALAVRDRLPKLERIVYIEPRGVNAYDDPILISWSEFLELGSRHLAAAPDDFDRLVDAIDVEETATIVYTSGTTGPPKGAMLSHRNLVWTAGEAKSVIAGTGAMPDRAELLSYLPLCHVFGRLYDLCYAIATRSTVNFAESIDTVVADLQEIQPSYFPAPPRIWEKMSAGAQIRIAHASPLKRLVYGAALQAGMWNADRMLQRGGRGLLGSVVYGAGLLLAYRSLQKKMGMSKCRQAVSGAAPIAPDLLKFFMAVGVPIVEGWGMTETTAMGTVNQLGSVKLGTIGEPLPGCEIEIAADGEILTRHPAVFKGYFKNPAATDEAIDGDGWLHTGDVGEWDGNHVRIIDRKKDIIITAGGKNISPSELENRLKVSPFIKEAMVVGDSRKFISALIGIEFDVAANWAQRRDITFTTYRDLSEKPEIIRLIDKQVEEANADFEMDDEIYYNLDLSTDINPLASSDTGDGTPKIQAQK